MASGYYRFPTIQGETTVFSCEDDLWSVPASGGIARRLTASLSEDIYPLLSSDGQKLAFAGRDEGHSEIYLMPAQGGPARRLTFMGALTCQPVAWTAEGKLIFASTAGHWYQRFTQLYQIDPSSGAPELINYGLARHISFGPNGGVVLGRLSTEPARWKRYRGGTAGQIWIDSSANGDFHHLIELGGNLANPIWLGERIYFISDHEGIGNLYSCLPDGTGLRRHTDHDDYYVRNPSSDGQQIVYHAGADLYLYSPQSDISYPIAIDFHSPQVQRSRKFVDPARYLEAWDLHPNGQSLAVTTRGKLFSFANWEGAVIQHGSDAEPLNSEMITTGIRYRLPCWLPDGKRMVAVTDAGGEEHFVILHADGSAEPQPLEALDIGRPEAVACNPHKDQIVFSNHRYELLVLDLETKELIRIDRGISNPILGFSWSPDGKWVVYSASISLQRQAIKLWNAVTREVTQITDPVLRDLAPSFEPHGLFIYFLSFRDFDPVYDNLQFDLGFPRGMRPYLITLKKDQVSPFIPQPYTEPEDEMEESKDEEKQEIESEENLQDSETPLQKIPDITPPEPPVEKEEEKKAPEIKEIEIDLEGIQERIIAFPVPEGRYRQVRGTRSGKVLYTRYPVDSTLDESNDEERAARGNLYFYNYEDQKEEMLVSGVTAFDVNASGAWMAYLSRNHLRIMKAGEKPMDDNMMPNRKSGWIDLSRLKVSIVPGAEWRQMFREAWRLQRDQFWTQDMSQVDWLAVHDRYLPLIDRVSSRSEFSDLMWEMQGELGTSHAYEFGGDYRPQPRYQQGYLGAEYHYHAESGGWQITRLLHGDPWSDVAQSPLLKPGMNVSEGDILISINGRKLNADISPGQTLVNMADEEVFLAVRSSDDPTLRYVTVKALGRDEPLRYRAWVETNRLAVHTATQGKVGYLHIPDMGPAGYAEFHRGYLSEIDRQGLIVDLRFNRGGHVSPLLLEKLARRRLGYDTARWSEIPNPYPPESVTGPIVALTNEYAGSDGDIFSHSFKMLKLGPLLGKRTWGGVIGIWPRHSLVDGTQTTQPEFSFWFEDVGWGVENYGTDPDIEIDNTPQDYMQSSDAQLERAITEALKLLADNPPSLPDFSQRPDRSLPRLPPR
ncbi:MAG TPA: S41 family peptidase [Anaerolineales bacterium]|nr:S41 family peptidase [Anaerolineales bacterium]